MAKLNRSEKEAFWRLALKEFQESELTIRAFCQREGLSEPSFYAWRKTIRNRNAKGLNGVANKQILVPVDVAAAVDASPRRKEPSPSLEVVTPNGFTLRFDQGLDPQRLDALLGVIAHSGGAEPC